MNWLLIKNDFKRNKIINVALLLFMIFSSTLAVLSVLMATQTITSISRLYKIAQPPHFVQMHKGEINQGELDNFISKYEGITYYQTGIMLDIYGDNLTVVRDRKKLKLSDCRLDIGLVRQNEARDLLLNSKHEKVTLLEGEMGVPVLLKQMYGINLGDHIILESNGIVKEFIVKEIILDSMMNSTMCSSTRILISDRDFNLLNGSIGENEYLIEAYFNNTKEAASFQTAYENAGLPQNGQAVTYTMIFLLSAITDIVTIFILIIVSLFLILVSFICVKFTIMAALEEDIREIGTMKAIGLPFRDIRHIYSIKYKVLAMIAVVLGYTLAILLSSQFTKHVISTFGGTNITSQAILLELLVNTLVYLFIVYYCNRVLRKIKKLTVVNALVNGNVLDKNNGSIRDGLNRSRKLPVNWLMGIREIIYKFKNWKLVFGVVLIAVTMLMVPFNLMNTFNSPKFITYMGSSLEDILIEVENGEKLEESYVNTKQLLDRDRAIAKYYEYRRVRVQTLNSEGRRFNLHIESGEYAGNELEYLNGKAPEGNKELAISYLNSKETGKQTGDKLTLFIGDGVQEFIISGVYQDVTSGGFTAKTKYHFSELPAEKYSFTVNLIEGNNTEKKAEEWSKNLGSYVTVDPMKELINQTLGRVVKQFRTSIVVIAIISTSLVVLITILFLRLRLAKDLAEIAALKAIGFSEGDIKKQYMIKIGCVSLLGIFLGILMTDILGERLVEGALNISGLGIRKVQLIANPLIEYIVYPILLITLVLFVTGQVMKVIRKYNIITIINE